MSRLLRMLAARGRDEGGLTVVEVVVAGLILTVGSLGVLGIVDAATRNTFRAEQSQLLNNVLQRELEQIRAVPYDELGLAALPSAGGGDNDPNSRVVGSGFQTIRSGSGLKPMVSGGIITAGPEDFQVEDVTGSIYRYVVWDDCPGALCVDGEYLKRVIIVAKLDATAPGGDDRPYREIQTQIVDPDAEPEQSPPPLQGGDAVTRWTLWLTDAPCDRTKPKTPAEREADGDHLAHNTRGDCADGLKTANEPGAPDLLWGEAPVLCSKEDIENGICTNEKPIYDYATDIEPIADPDKDKGLQILEGADCGSMPAGEIASGPDADASMYQKLHKWVTPPVPGEITDFALTGEGKFHLWTQSIEHGVYPATICAWLFVRDEAGDTALVQPLEALPYTQYGQTTWPYVGLTEVTVSFDLTDPEGGGKVPLPPGSQLGLALSVDDDSGSGVQILYDEPSFDSRLRLETTGTLPEWPAP